MTNNDGSVELHRAAANLVVQASGDATGSVTWPDDPTTLTCSFLGDSFAGHLLDAYGVERGCAGTAKYVGGRLEAEAELTWTDGPSTVVRRMSFDLARQ